MRARSTRSPPACCRSRSARRPRPCRSWSRAASTTASRSASAPRPTPTTRKARSWRRATKRPTRAEIEARLADFTGEIEQVPPRYSALKVDGERAYELARDEEEFELQPRRVSIESLVLVDHPDQDRCVLETHCGKGTYVRSLARDLGRALGALGHVEALRRTRVGPFGEERAVSLPALEALARERRSRGPAERAAPPGNGALRHPGAECRGARRGPAPARAGGVAQGARCPHSRRHWSMPCREAR